MTDPPMETEDFEVHSPAWPGHDLHEDKLEDGPTGVSERRLHTPVRKAPTMTRKRTHEEEPDTKKVILGDMTDDENKETTAAEISALSARLEDKRIVCMAVMGKNLHDVYSNERIKMAVNRQSAKMLMGAAAAQPLVNAVPEAGALLTGAIGGQEEPT